MLLYLIKTQDRDALHICKGNQKMWQTNLLAVILYEQFSDILSNARIYSKLNHKNTAYKICRLSVWAN